MRTFPEKQAGLLQPPPKMVAILTRWVQSRTSDYLLFYRNYVPGLTEVAKRLSTGALPKSQDQERLRIDLRGWKYLRDADRFRKRLSQAARDGLASGSVPSQTGMFLGRVLGRDTRVRDPKDIKKALGVLQKMGGDELAEAIIGSVLTVWLDLRGSSGHGGRSFEGYGNTIEIRPLTVEPSWEPRRVKEQYRDYMETLHEICAHELTHQTQKFLDALHALPQGSAGKPSRTTHSYKGTNPAILHALKDSEFYTRLRDEVEKFHREVGRMVLPPDSMAEFHERHRRSWVGGKGRRRMRPPESFFFRVLKEYDFKKYRKAVGEFWKQTEPSHARVAARWLQH